MFGFAAVVCVVCSVALSGVSLSLRDQQNLNRERDLHKNILGALGLPEDGSQLDGPKIDELWESRVQQRFITPDNKPAGKELEEKPACSRCASESSRKQPPRHIVGGVAGRVAHGAGAGP